MITSAQVGASCRQPPATRQPRRAHSERRHPRRGAMLSTTDTDAMRVRQLIGAILDGAATTAANTYADARRVALHLHDDCHEDAQLALSIANALTCISTQAHEAAELAAQIGGVTWP